MKTLVAGWFSFEHMGASAGDILARDVACRWLDEAGQPYDVALAPSFDGGVDWQEVDPKEYGRVVFVCGPFGNGELVAGFLERFAGRLLVGLDLTMLEPLEAWNPFDLLIERDSSAAARPDISFASDEPRVPVAATVLIDDQPEYGARARQREANELLKGALDDRGIAAIAVDTRLDRNRTGFTTAAQIESVIARCDLVMTTRLHGLVLAIKNGVPSIAVDSVEGGAKIHRQARTIGWPCAFTIDEVGRDDVERALDFCLSKDGRDRATACARQAIAAVEQARREFLAGIREQRNNRGE